MVIGVFSVRMNFRHIKIIAERALLLLSGEDDGAMQLVRGRECHRDAAGFDRQNARDIALRELRRHAHADFPIDIGIELLIDEAVDLQDTVINDASFGLNFCF